MNTHEECDERGGEAPPDQPLPPVPAPPCGGAGTARAVATNRYRSSRLPPACRAAILWRRVSRRHLLDLAVDSSGDLLPRRDRRRRLGVLELFTEHPSSSSRRGLRPSQAACTAGRSFTVSYHNATSGRAAYSTNAHPHPCCRPARTRRGCRRRRRMYPSLVGWWATVHVSGSAPASVTRPIIHGPLMSARWFRRRTEPRGNVRHGGEDESSRRTTVVRQRLDTASESSVKLLSASTISPPACQKNGMNVCHPADGRQAAMPHSAPPSTSLGELGELVPVGGAWLKPPSSARSVW